VRLVVATAMFFTVLVASSEGAAKREVPLKPLYRAAEELAYSAPPGAYVEVSIDTTHCKATSKTRKQWRCRLFEIGQLEDDSLFRCEAVVHIGQRGWKLTQSTCPR
jgi:hypothetical protein